jgi:hypothetical protein
MTETDERYDSCEDESPRHHAVGEQVCRGVEVRGEKAVLENHVSTST